MLFYFYSEEKNKHLKFKKSILLNYKGVQEGRYSMKKRELALMMLGILVAHNLSFAADVYAVGTEASVTADSLEQAVNLEEVLEAEMPPVDAAPVETSESSEQPQLPEITAEASVNESQPTAANESSEANQSKEKVINEAPQSTRKTATVNGEMLKSVSVLDSSGNEYSQTEVNRVLNTSSIKLLFEFSSEGINYESGQTYEVALPANLTYVNETGEIAGIGATWSVDDSSKMLRIQFNQRIADTSFYVNVTTHLTTIVEPLVTLTMPGKTPKTYHFDLYENVESIKYEESSYNYGINGEIFYNLDRNLSGNQSLEIIVEETPGAAFQAKDEQLIVASYRVDVKGNILANTKTILSEGTDYNLTANSFKQTSISIANMDQQRAYSVSIKRAVHLESLSEVQYSFDQKYPTTKVGTVGLKQTNHLTFVAKTSTNQKEIARRNVETQSYVAKASKGKYSIVIYNNLTATKAGQQIILESKNGQALNEYSFVAQNEQDQTVPVAEYFKVESKNNQLILTATKDSILKLTLSSLKVNLAYKDFALTLATPAVQNSRVFDLILDEYVETLALLNPENSEVAWGTLSESGNNENTAAVSVIGNEDAPVKNLTIKVKHPRYLSLRVPKEIQNYYKLNQHYTVTPTTDGTIIRFTSPIQHELNMPLNFNYVPDGLAKQESIPIDVIPVTVDAENYETVSGTVVTNQKRGSEQVLQSSGNQFLINARNDSFDSLKVKITIPEGAKVLFDIYDVSNGEVAEFHPQNWDRKQHFTKIIAPESAEYPTITYDSQKKSYTYDFGQTNKRYILVFKNANGWMDTRTILITGSTAEPLNENQELQSTIALPNVGSNILTATQIIHENYKNVTQSSVSTKNINDTTHKIENPTFELNVKGTTNAVVDLRSVVVDNVPESAYTVEKTDKGAKIVFENYTLTENITFHFNLISDNAGLVYTEVKIAAAVLNETLASRKVILTPVANLTFAEGEAAGVVFLADAKFQIFEENEQEHEPMANVKFELIDKVSNEVTSFTSTSSGEIQQHGIMSGEYILRVTEIPVGYTIADEYRSGKTIRLVKGENLFEIPLKKKEDKTSITVKDSTLYVGDSWQPKDNFDNGTDEEGQPVTIDQILVTGNVNTSTVGDYQVTYKNNTKEATAVVHVIANQSTLVVKDTTIYVGDTWQKADNFVSATDRDGQPISVEAVQLTGTVDSTVVGIYEVTYTLGSQTQIAKITVIADQTSVSAKDSTIYVGSEWHPEDNFVTATDRDGNLVPFGEITVTGTVDTAKVGDYQVRYQNGHQTASATIRVVADQETVVVKDSTLYVGDSWTAADNFLGATDRQGTEIPLQDITVTGTVDVNKAGSYEVAYHYGQVTSVAKITVKADLSSITVVDSTIYVGDDWNPEDNFVSATDRDGHDIEFEKVTVEGNVKTAEKGDYEIAYTAQTQTRTTTQSNKSIRMKSTPKQAQQLSVVAKVTVLDKTTSVKTTKTPKTVNQTTAPKENNINKENYTKKEKVSAKQYPKTGTRNSLYLNFIGSFICIISLIRILFKQKRSG
jgi:hypothetical protein